MLYILVDDIVKARFFRFFQKSEQVVFITNKPSCFYFLKQKTKNRIIFLMKKNEPTENTNVDAQRLSKTISVLTRRQSLDDAIKNYFFVYNSLAKQLNGDISEEDIVVIFNGNHATALATVDFFVGASAKTLYAEISNLPDKMIFDPNGVNAQSILYSQPEVLDALESVSDLEHEAWIDSYVKYKENPIPQSKISIPTYFQLACDDLLSRIFSCFIKEDSLSFTDKVQMFSRKYKSRKILNAAGTVNLDCKYVFYPTQVTSDTQLKINSDIDNIKAINLIIDCETDTEIFVKIHPAESDITTINYFVHLAQKGVIKLVNNNTVDLIKNAFKVYTVNSTVGLEALIFDKNLTVLGRAIYSNFDATRLRLYIHRYLMDLNYFGENVLTEEHYDKLTKLSEL